MILTYQNAGCGTKILLILDTLCLFFLFHSLFFEPMVQASFFWCQLSICVPSQWCHTSKWTVPQQSRKYKIVHFQNKTIVFVLFSFRVFFANFLLFWFLHQNFLFSLFVLKPFRFKSGACNWDKLNTYILSFSINHLATPFFPLKFKYCCFPCFLFEKFVQFVNKIKNCSYMKQPSFLLHYLV